MTAAIVEVPEPQVPCTACIESADSVIHDIGASYVYCSHRNVSAMWCEHPKPHWLIVSPHSDQTMAALCSVLADEQRSTTS